MEMVKSKEYYEYQREWRKRNPEKAKLYNQRDRARKKAQGYKLEYTSEYYQKHKKVIDAAHKRYVEKNKKKINDYTNQYIKDHPTCRKPLTPEQIEKRRKYQRERYNKLPEVQQKRKERYERIKDTEHYKEQVQRYRKNATEKRRALAKLRKEQKLKDEMKVIILTEDQIEIHKKGIAELIEFFNNSSTS